MTEAELLEEVGKTEEHIEEELEMRIGLVLSASDGLCDEEEGQTTSQARRVRAAAQVHSHVQTSSGSQVKETEATSDALF